MSRVVVVGGGVIGCAVAERLSLEKHQVTLLERDQLACRASGAAAGELSPSSLASDSESLAMFPELVARIEKDSAMNVEFRVQQGLKPAFTSDEARTLNREGGRWLDAAECRKAEPAISTDVLGAVLLEHAHLMPPQFVRALARAAAARRAEICEGTPATGFDITRDEIHGVRTPAGNLAADWAVIAGGTEEDSGFDDRPTVAGIATLLELARKLVPGLAAASLQRVWAGLRPVTADGKPIVAVTGPRNLIVATGHHRKGILLAPLAAMQVADLITMA